MPVFPRVLNRLGLSLVLAAALATAAPAQSPWARLSRSLGGKVSAARAQTAPAVAEAKTSASATSAPAASAQAVADENPGPGRAGAAGVQLVSNPPAGGFFDLSRFKVQDAGKSPGKADLGLEAEDNDTQLATNLFKKPEIRRLLGDSPRFIYDPEDRPDPMLVPWVRRSAIFKELSDLADANLQKGSMDQAVAVYQKILAMNDPRFTMLAQAKLAEIAQKQNKAAVDASKAAKAVEEKVELPAWVQDNTSGVIIQPGSEQCLVGEFMLRVGETLPNYPEIRIASIQEKTVTYQIKNKTFVVNLNQEP